MGVFELKGNGYEFLGVEVLEWKHFMENLDRICAFEEGGYVKG